MNLAIKKAIQMTAFILTVIFIICGVIGIYTDTDEAAREVELATEGQPFYEAEKE